MKILEKKNDLIYNVETLVILHSQIDADWGRFENSSESKKL